MKNLLWMEKKQLVILNNLQVGAINRKINYCMEEALWERLPKGSVTLKSEFLTSIYTNIHKF